MTSLIALRAQAEHLETQIVNNDKGEEYLTWACQQLTLVNNRISEQL